MTLLQGLRARIRVRTNPNGADTDLHEEIRFHIDLETEKNLASG